MPQRPFAPAGSAPLGGPRDPMRLWGPYLSERQWGTVREDYSEAGDCWRSFPHDHARSRAYRWGEDGLLGLCDREARLCFALSLWNGRDPILKERLFGLSNPEGNHGEDVKELYYYLDATPGGEYLKALYKYPLAEFPYGRLVGENGARSKRQGEYELLDTEAFAEGHVDVQVEYAKAAEDDILVRVTLTLRADARATVYLLPTLWFRNTWSWGGGYEHAWGKPSLRREGDAVVARHATLGAYRLDAEGADTWVFTDNETNRARLWGVANPSPYVKDAFHRWRIEGDRDAVNPAEAGTKAAASYALALLPGVPVTVRLRLRAVHAAMGPAFSEDFASAFAARASEADEFYAARTRVMSPEEARVFRQASAGLVWSQQFYYYHVRDWVRGDPNPPPPPAGRQPPNAQWGHVFARDVLSVPDKWEFPWFAVWDTAFHMVPYADLDADFAKDQLLRFLREWYMHPNGQLAAYEFNFGDVNPPVHAWACRRVYERDGRRDRDFLARAFHKLNLNFTWWVNRKDTTGRHLFSGGFLGLDNIGVFDRSRPLYSGGHLEQADGTAWMAFYCAEMLAIALELAAADPVYEDMASKYLEHYVAIADAINTLDDTGLWDEDDGFYYDHLHHHGHMTPLRLRSMVGLIPLFAVELLHRDTLARLPAFRRRLGWFVQHRPELLGHLELPGPDAPLDRPSYLLSLPSRAQLERIVRVIFDAEEFLSPYGVRSLSKAHEAAPFRFHDGGRDHAVRYVPGESESTMFGGNSNWRGPVWFPVNYLLVEALQRYGAYYGDALRVEVPAGSGRWCTLAEAAEALSERLVALFLPDDAGRRACHGDAAVYARDPVWRELVLFYEYFHGDDGRGCGASHQTGWTALVATLLRDRRGG